MTTKIGQGVDVDLLIHLKPISYVLMMRSHDFEDKLISLNLMLMVLLQPNAAVYQQKNPPNLGCKLLSQEVD